MSDEKKPLPFINPKKAICKWDACSTDANVKGYCRLHFLKSLKTKRSEAEEEIEREAIARMKRERRRANRLMGPEDNDSLEQPDLQARVGSLDSIDLDFEVLEDDMSGGKPRKTGTEE